jgi:hypothetical protein
MRFALHALVLGTVELGLHHGLALALAFEIGFVCDARTFGARARFGFDPHALDAFALDDAQVLLALDVDLDA